MNSKAEVSEFTVIGETFCDQICCIVEATIVSNEWEELLICIDLFCGVLVFRHEAHLNKFSLCSQRGGIPLPKHFCCVPSPVGSGSLIIVSEEKKIHVLNFEGNELQVLNQINLEKQVSMLQAISKNRILFGTNCGSFGVLKVLNFAQSKELNQIYSISSGFGEDSPFLFTKATDERAERMLKDYLASSQISKSSNSVQTNQILNWWF